MAADSPPAPSHHVCPQCGTEFIEATLSEREWPATDFVTPLRSETVPDYSAKVETEVDAKGERLWPEIEKQIGQLSHKVRTPDWLMVLPLLNRCSQIIKGFEERLARPSIAATDPTDADEIRVVLDRYENSLKLEDGDEDDDREKEAARNELMDVLKRAFSAVSHVAASSDEQR